MHAMKGLPVQLEGVSHSPIQWSPCSQFVCLSIYSHGETFRERLIVMNLSLEELFSMPAFDSYVDIEACVHSAWSSDCTLVGASCSLEPDAPCELDICWHASMPDPGSGIAAVQARALLAGLQPGGLVQRLASGPDNSFAVVVDVPYVLEHGDNGTKQPCTPCRRHKLYALLPGHRLASMLLPITFNQDSSLIFSPSGCQLLVGCGRHLELVTSMCQSVQSFPGCNGAFAPDGRVAAVVGPSASGFAVRLVRTADGQQIFSLACSSLGSRQLSFNFWGNQLLLSSRIICFGLNDATIAIGRQLCHAISISSSWASSMMQENFASCGCC